jgi:hypothetical protein
MKKTIAKSMELIRPAGIVLTYFIADSMSKDSISFFHILGPWVVIIMSGTVAFEGLFLGEVASEKIGYKPNRAYQIQSALNNAATAVTALLVFILDWGRYADATIVVVMLIFFVFSAINHVISAFREKNMKSINLMRPIMILLLAGFLIPPMLKALSQ